MNIFNLYKTQNKDRNIIDKTYVRRYSVDMVNEKPYYFHKMEGSL